MSTDTERPEPRVGIDWARTVAAALAAVSSAVLLSTLGAVGTIIGAAVGSIIASVGTALYAQALARSKQTVAKAQENALTRIGVAQSEVRRAQRRGGGTPSGEAHLEHADEVLAAAKEELVDGADPRTDDEPGVGWRERLVGLPWKRITAFAAAVFVVAIVTLTVFELVSGRSVSSITGDDDRRTTIIGGSDDADRDEQQLPDEQPPDGVTPTEQPTEQPTEAPSEATSPSEGTTPTPTPTPQETPTAPPSSPAPTE